jgi:lipid-binding SYLF domain-containing protein
MRAPRIVGKVALVACVCLVGSLLLPSASYAATAQAIDTAADKTIEQFKTQVKGGDAFLRGAKGVLVFPEVIQAGIGIGGEYGEGVLRVGGGSVAYYSIKAGSIGFQLGAQRKSILVVFLQDQALEKFRDTARADKSWQVGVDGSVTLLNLGAQASINSATVNQPIVGFVFGQAGLMYNLSLQGSKVSKIDR